MLAHETVLQDQNALYPMKRVSMKHISIPAGQTHAPLDNIIMGQLPNLIMLAMVSDASMAGGYQQNPFNFQHFGLNHLALYVNGDMVPRRPLQPDFPSGQYLRCYNAMLEALAIQFTNQSIPISRNEYGNGYTFFIFDITPDKSATTARTSPRTGSIRVEIKFPPATT